MEASSTATMAPVLLRNMVTSFFAVLDHSLNDLSKRSRLLEFLRYLVTSFFLFFLRVLPPTFIPARDSVKTRRSIHAHAPPPALEGGSAIARALCQLLDSVRDIPVNSRKYDVVRSLAEKVIDDNNVDGFDSLREVNRRELCSAFERTLSQLEAMIMDQEPLTGSYGPVPVDFYSFLGRAFRALRYVGDTAWSRVVKPPRVEEEVVMSGLGNSAEKLAAEALWLAQKLVACGFAGEAVSRWASGSKLAWLALSADPRLQASLVKVSALLVKQAKDMGREGEEEVDEACKEEEQQTKMKMLMSWLPLLCRASNGTDTPTLTITERAELEKVMERMIEMLGQEDQEKVLSLWLHHFAHCPLSDWPDLHHCYARWCTASRRLLLFSSNEINTIKA